MTLRPALLRASFALASIAAGLAAAGCGVRTDLEIGIDGAAPIGRDAGRRDGGLDGSAPLTCRGTADCDDGLFCNGVERCAVGRCVPGGPPACDDGVECTVDVCDEAIDACRSEPDDARCGGAICDPMIGCTSPPCLDDLDCDDGLACNGRERCASEGRCAPPLVPPRCDDGIDCTVEVCREPDGVCTSTPDASRCGPGRTCDPGLGCTGGACDDDADCLLGSVCGPSVDCIFGACTISASAPCSDGIRCTADECVVAAGGCVSTPDSSRCTGEAICVPGSGTRDGCTVRRCTMDFECDDGSVCNGVERCVSRVCRPGAPLVCDDGLACSTDRCVDALGGCVSEPREMRETCGDGVDDDCDARIDCADEDCRGTPGCPP